MPEILFFVRGPSSTPVATVRVLPYALCLALAHTRTVSGCVDVERRNVLDIVLPHDSNGGRGVLVRYTAVAYGCCPSVMSRLTAVTELDRSSEIG